MNGKCPKCGYEEPAASNRPAMISATMGPIRDSGPKFAIGQYRSEGEQQPSPNLHLFVDQRAIDLGAEFPGKRVRLLVDVATQGGEVFKAGTEFLISNTWRGRFNLTGHDGGVYRVHRDRFEVLK